MTKPAPEHKDKLGNPISVGDYVAYPIRNSLEFGQVKKINAKMIGVQPVFSNWAVYSNTNKYPGDMVRLPAADMTWYVLKHQAK